MGAGQHNGLHWKLVLGTYCYFIFLHVLHTKPYLKVKKVLVEFITLTNMGVVKNFVFFSCLVCFVFMFSSLSLPKFGSKGVFNM